MNTTSNFLGYVASRASKARLSVGIVGAGVISHQLHIPVLLNMPDVVIRWVADANEARSNNVGSAYKLPSIVMDQPQSDLDCDITLLAIPTGARDKYYEHLSRCGIAVFAEKTLALTAQKHRHVCAMFPDDRLGCGYQRRTYGSVRAIAEFARNNIFGELLAMRVFEGDRTARTRVDSSYIDDPSQSGGGVLAAIGCHIIDAAMFITRADSFALLSRSAHFDGGIDRRFEARVKLRCAGAVKSDVELEFCVSWLDKQVNTITAEFERAIITAPTGPSNRLRICSRDGKILPISFVYEGVGAVTANQACFLEWTAFLEGLRSGQPSQFSGVESTLTAELIDVLYQGYQ